MVRYRKTVVLLGAGASHGSKFRLPLMARILDWSTLGSAEFTNLKKALQLFAKPGSHVDLEGFLTHLDMTISTFLERWNRERTSPFSEVVESARRELGDYLASRLSHDQIASEEHSELFKKLGPEGTVLTLNYDRIADCSLMDVDGTDVQGFPNQTGRLGLSYQL